MSQNDVLLRLGVCFELNAAVVVVAVLVLRHTSSVFMQVGPEAGPSPSLPGALIRNRRRLGIIAALLRLIVIEFSGQAASSSGTQVQQAAH